MFCYHCGKKIPEEANFCMHCGVEIKNVMSKDLNEEDISQGISYPYSNLPTKLYIGPEVTNWLFNDYAFSAYFNEHENTTREILPGDVNIFLHKYGISIISGGIFNKNTLEIHYLQIISMKYENRVSLTDYIEKNKTIIGRAVMGGLILGPIGAIVGGVTGLGTKKDIYHDYLIINLWNTFTKKPQTILLCGKNKKTEFERVIRAVGKYSNKYKNKWEYLIKT